MYAPARVRKAAGMSILHRRHPRFERHRPASGTPPDAGPERLLYDQACDLLLAARGLRAVAGADGAQPAIAATLGCLEATFDALADTMTALRAQAAEQAVAAGGGERRRETLAGARRVIDQCDETARALRAARDMTGGLRERVGPALAELSA
jgi:hypothetical protein